MKNNKNNTNHKNNNKFKNRISLRLAPISLMFPDARISPPVTTGAWENDLALGDVIKALTLDKRYATYIRQMLLALTTDVDVIRWRQEILTEFLNNPSLPDAIEALLPSFSSLRQGNSHRC